MMLNRRSILFWVWIAAAGMTGSAVAEADTSGTRWLANCVEAAPKNAPCIGYIAAMQDMNEMLADVFERPLWCAPKAVTVGKLRQVIVSDLAEAPSSRLEQPFAGLATLALKARFPCEDSTTPGPGPTP
jgi:hypothetical protein